MAISTRTRIRHAVVIGLLALGLCACGKQAPGQDKASAPAAGGHVQRLSDGIVVSLDGSPQKVRLRVVSDRIIHVTVVPKGGFKNLPASLMAVKTGGDKDFTVHEKAGSVELDTPAVEARVSLDDGAVRFLDHDGKTILAERPDGRTFTPTQVGGESFYAIRQQWLSPSNEAFYGLGQHQEGVMDYKGKDVQLAQHNMDIAIPFVVSSRNYGVLWDNNSITRFGDPRPYPFVGKGKGLKLFDADGKPGGLTASYYVNGKLKLRRDEATIDYKFLKDVKRWPAQLVDAKGVGGGPGQTVQWKGQIASEVAGVHKFRLYVSGYFKLYIGGKLIESGWRQNWNPWYRDFTLKMQPGKKYPIRIEWTPQSGYIALQHLDPLPPKQQNELSLYSQLGHSINYYFIAGKNLHGVIAGYRKVTGKAVMLPRWAYGFWQSRDHYETQKQILGVAAKYRKLGLPLDNIVQDWRYWTDPTWGSHKFDPARYPDPKAMIARLHDEHVHFMISVWAKFYPSTEHYKELAAHGDLFMHAIKKGYKDWVGPGYHFTFYDPYSKQARQLYWKQMRQSLGDLGVDAWWLDSDEPDMVSNTSFAERKKLMSPTPLGPGAAFFNSYPLVHTMGVYKGSRRSYPDKRVFILSRSSFAGQQRNAAASWSGDVTARWDDLRRQISAGVNFSMSGIPNWTTDIGGYVIEPRYVHPDAANLAEWRELNLRWFQFAAFCPIFRSHGQGRPREIWNIAPPGSPVYKGMAWYDKLRYRLMPYIYTLAANTWWKNGTIMRGLPMDFPNDPKVRTINDEYLFGPAFLVAPVTQYQARSRKVYLPAGAGWYSFNTGKFFQGGQSVDAPAPLSRMPVFVRAGSIVPTGEPEQYTGEHPDAPVTLLVYAGADGHFSLYEDDGTSYGYEKGHYSRVAFDYDDAAGTLTIGARQGDGTGAPAKREFLIRRVDAAHPDPYATDAEHDVQVQYTGKKVTVRL